MQQLHLQRRGGPHQASPARTAYQLVNKWRRLHKDYVNCPYCTGDILFIESGTHWLHHKRFFFKT
jgi:hypothetical protein